MQANCYSITAGSVAASRGKRYIYSNSYCGQKPIRLGTQPLSSINKLSLGSLVINQFLVTLKNNKDIEPEIIISNQGKLATNKFNKND